MTGIETKGMRPSPLVPPQPIEVTPLLLQIAKLIDLQAFDSDVPVGAPGYDAILARQKYAIDTAHTIEQLFQGPDGTARHHT